MWQANPKPNVNIPYQHVKYKYDPKLHEANELWRLGGEFGLFKQLAYEFRLAKHYIIKKGTKKHDQTVKG